MTRSPLLLLGLLLPTACVAPGHEREEWIAAGHRASAEVHTTIAADAPPLLEEIRTQLDEGLARIDPRGAGSEVARLNRAPRGEFQRIDDTDVFRCLSLALRHARASDGAYDPTVGDDLGFRHVALERELRSIRLPSSTLELDLGAVGRGCALDWAARIFARPGARAGLLRLDRVVWAWREPPGSPVWRVVVEDPRDPSRALATVDLANRALATAHAPASTDVRVALAVADAAADAAALAHALVALGPLDAARAIESTPRAEALLVVGAGPDGASYVLASASLEGRIELSPALSAETARDLRFLLPPTPP